MTGTVENAMSPPRALLVWAAMGAAPLGAQSGFFLGAGLARYDQADAFASPLPYGGAGPWAALAWRHDGTTWLRGIELTFTTATLAPTPEGTWTSTARAHTGALTVHWLRRLDAGGRSGLYAGGRLRTVTSVRFHYFANGIREIYGDLIVAPELAGAWGRRLGVADRVRAELSVPVASLAWRTPYFGAKVAPRAEVAGPGRLRGATLEAEYLRVLTPALGAVVRLGLQAWRYPDPRPITAVTQRLELQLRLGGAVP